MKAQTYACDGIDVWHAIKHVDEFGHRARGKCRHDFAFTKPPVAKRPHPDKYCAGCLGVEEREAEAAKKKGEANGQTA
jgi:hypothetical protein